jgi:tRNA threonylcarbamoyladenosine biosynthesis protein TsaE
VSGATRRLTVPDEAAMVALGRRIAALLAAGQVVFLSGELGAGKTTLSRGILLGLGHEGAVKSPTYTLLEPYEHTRPPVYHFDLYRLADAEELEWLGARDLFGGQALCLIEWPERGAGFLPPADLIITIGSPVVSTMGREVCVEACGAVAEGLARWDAVPG